MNLVEIKDVRVGQAWKADKDVLYIVSDYNKPFVPSSISIESFESAGLQNRYTIIGKLGITHRIEDGKLVEIPRTAEFQIDDVCCEANSKNTIFVIDAIDAYGREALFLFDEKRNRHFPQGVEKVGIFGVTREFVNDREA